MKSLKGIQERGGLYLIVCPYETSTPKGQSFPKTMKKVAKIAVSGRKKGTYKRICDGYDWKLDDLVFDKEEKRSKKPVK